MHLKEFVGGESDLGYWPLGQGNVNIPAILEMMNGKSIDGMVMVELDSSPDMPVPAAETARIARAYLVKQGIPFRH
jgi:inosose dehydratase